MCAQKMRNPTGAVVVGEVAWAFLNVHKTRPGQSPAFPRLRLLWRCRSLRALQRARAGGREGKFTAFLLSVSGLEAV
jgi:hypothetical protein